MNKKIRIAVVDDDESMHDILLDLYQDSELIDIKYNYVEPRKFMEDAPTMDFDLCFLDITMPDLDGITLAQLLKNKPVIFITGSEDRLRDALHLAPLDVITKPFTKLRLDQGIQMAHKLLAGKIDHGVFNVAESKRKIKICLSDIVFVDTDEVDPRHKPIIMRNGAKYTLMDCSMEDLLSLAPHLVQVNRRQLLALDNIGEMQHDCIAVTNPDKLNLPAEVTLSRTFTKEVKKRMFYK